MAIISCNNSDGPGLQVINQEKKIIPYFEDSLTKNSRQELYLKNIAKTMGLPPVDDNKTGISVRIWFWENDTKYVLSIGRQGSTSKSHIIEWTGKKENDTNYIVIQKEWQNITPASGWDNFWKQFEASGIKNLSGGKSAKELNPRVTRMAYVQFEISDEGKYRFFEYLEPSYYRYADAASGTVFNFLQYVNVQLKVEVYSPLDTVSLRPQ